MTNLSGSHTGAAAPLQYDAFGTYSPESVAIWCGIAEKNRLRDEMFISKIVRHFRDGSVLELGGAVGQIAEYLSHHGLSVVGSDLRPFFVDYMRARGLEAEVIDATDITASCKRSFDNVFSQGLSPQMFRDRDVALKTYTSIHRALKPNGRYISVCGTYRFRARHNQKKYYAPSEHLENIRTSGLFKVIDVIPHMVVPPSWYSDSNKRVLNWIDFSVAKLLCNRYVYVLEKI